MLNPHGPREMIRRNNGPSREFSRIPVIIPVGVEIPPASKGEVLASVPGLLLDISCSGGKVRIRWDLPRGMRLFIFLPAGTPGLRLPAEIVWGSPAPGLGKEPAMYGVRWIDPLSAGALQAALLGQDFRIQGETAHAPRI